MRWSTAARWGILISVFSAASQPAMAQQHHNGGRPAAAPAPHPGMGGVHQIPPHMQQQMMQQQQMMMRQQQQMMQHYQQQIHQQYQQQVKQFNAYLKANGHSGSAASQLPKDPAGFDQWAATQRQRKAQGKSYDQLYDHFRSFADATGSNNAQHGHNASGQSQPAAQNKGKNASQAGSAGSTGNGNGTTTAQAAQKGGSTHNAKSANAQQKHAEAAHEEHRLAELKREEHRLAELKREEARRAAARQANANNRRVLAQDQGKVNLLLTVHSKLRQADHDYAGNRVRAMELVGHAIHQLGSSAPMAIGSGLGNLSQGQSDGILRDALHNLRAVHSQLGGTTGSAPHHAAARVSVAEAIQHLEVALRIR
jgi:hypothetical protein